MFRIILTILGAIYALLPYDLLPDFIVGAGWIDDLIILYCLWLFFYSRGRRHAERSGGSPGYERMHRRSEDAGAGGGTSAAGKKRTPHEVLGVSPGASKADIRRAYRQLAARYHPDKVQHLGEEFQALAEERFKMIQDAYRALMQDR